MSDVRQLLGLRIKELRRSRSLTQEQLAEIVNIEPNNLSRIENGKNYPAPENLSKIAEALGAEIYELFIFNHLQKIEDLKKIIKKKIDSDDNFTRLVYKFYQTVK